MARKIRYSEIVSHIDIDALEEIIEWSPEWQDGEEDRGFCVFPENHSNGDTTGKFSINREKRIWGCWVCGGGNLLDLVMEVMDQDEDNALLILSQICGDVRTDENFADEFLAAFTADVERRADTLPYFNERVLDKWDIPGDLWLKQRGISYEISDEFKLRWASGYRKPHPTGGKFADDEDYIGSGIIFPHFWQGRLVGWQIRWDDHGQPRPEWVPKYVNTHDFPKESTLYGYESTLAALREAGHRSENDVDRSGAGDNRIPPVIVCESVPTVLFCLSAGLPAVATFGDTVAGGQLRLLRRFQCGVILAPDNDKAGDHFEAVIKNYLEPFIPVYVAHRVPGEKADLGDLAPDYEALYEWIADTPGL